VVRHGERQCAFAIAQRGWGGNGTARNIKLVEDAQSASRRSSASPTASPRLRAGVMAIAAVTFGI